MPPGATYHLYVANESSDMVSRLAFTPGRGIEVTREIPVGIMPADNDGAHGLAVSADGAFWYVTLAHGTPFGWLWKFAAGEDTLVARTELGMFPATAGITPDGQFLLIVNFNLHGDPEPSSVSVVYTPTMTEVRRIGTCVMPHGSRVNAAGTKHYSACMHSQQLVEIDLATFQVSGRFSVAPGHEGALALGETGAGGTHAAGGASCSPTWAEPATGARANRFVYVPCNRGGEVLEVDVERWQVTRRFATGRGPYNLEATPDGRYLLATLKGDQAMAVFDVEAGVEVALIATSRSVTHGVVASPDSRYAFVSNEAVGGTRGTVDVIDLSTFQLVASAEVRHQPGGIDLWKVGR